MVGYSYVINALSGLKLASRNLEIPVLHEPNLWSFIESTTLFSKNLYNNQLSGSVIVSLAGP